MLLPYRVRFAACLREPIKHFNELKAVDLVIPGTPGFLLRMMRGKSKTHPNCIAPDQAKADIAAMLVPEAKAQCTIQSHQLSASRFGQLMSCPDKQGGALRVARTESYKAKGFIARMTMTASPPGFEPFPCRSRDVAPQS